MQTLYFCHVPRTGGTTIAHLLQSKYQALKVGSKTLPDLEAECLYGHFNYTKKPGIWITFIRNPYTRLEALYNHHLKYNPELSGPEFLEKIGPDPMYHQLQYGQFDFVGQFEDFENEFYRLCDFLGIKNQKIRQTHALANKVPLEIPPDFLIKEMIMYEYYLDHHVGPDRKAM